MRAKQDVAHAQTAHALRHHPPRASRVVIGVALIGCGGHARSHHLPALDRLRDQAAVRVLCDSSLERVEHVAGDWPEAECSDDWEQAIARDDVDAVMLCVPPALTPRMSIAAVTAGKAVLCEKPLAVDLDAARELVAATTGARIMVSLNRRFDPALRTALAAIGERRLDHVRACMVRSGRDEADFVRFTALHAIDALRFACGDLALERVRAVGTHGLVAELTTAAGAPATLEILPTSGGWEESYTFSGEGWRIEAAAQERCRIWRGGEAVENLPSEGRDTAERFGTLAETEAFLAAVRGERAFDPTPSDALASMELAAAIAQAAGFTDGKP